jgi:hypothetical protein
MLSNINLGSVFGRARLPDFFLGLDNYFSRVGSLWLLTRIGSDAKDVAIFPLLKMSNRGFLKISESI